MLFSHFRPLHPLQAPLLISGLGDWLSLFRFHYWCLIGSFYPFKSTILTYLMVTGSFSAFSPFSPPAGSTSPQRMGGSIIVLWKTLLVFCFCLLNLRMLTYPLLQVLFSHFRPFHPCRPHSSPMGGRDPLYLFRRHYWRLICSLYLCKSTILILWLQVLFSLFHPFHPCRLYSSPTDGGIHDRSSEILRGIYSVHSIGSNWGYWPILLLQVLFSHFRPFHSLQAPLLIDGWGYPLSLIGHRYLHSIGSLYLFKSTILTYPMVAGLFSYFRAIPHWGLGAYCCWQLCVSPWIRKRSNNA